MARKQVAAPLDARNRTRAQLADLLHLQLPESPLAEEPRGEDGRCPAPRVAVRPVPPELMPSSWRAPGDWLVEGRTLVSLALDRCRLRWLHDNRFGRGRRFEELGWLSVFEDGELVVASPVGVRMHGNTGRSRAPYNYRLYIRRAFGRARLATSWLRSDLDGTLEQVVLKRDLGALPGGRPWPLVESVAYAVGRRLGAHVPGFRPVAFSLNGNSPRAYAVSERITPSFLERRFGDGDFELLRGKVRGAQREVEARHRLVSWVWGAPPPLLASRVAERFDLDCLLDSLVTALVVGAGDPFQDALVRDRRAGTHGGRWFFVLWDHDFGFRDSPRFPRFRGGAPDLLAHVLRPPSSADTVTSLLASRLLREDPAFRVALVRRLVRAFAHEIPPAALDAIVAEQERQAAALPLADTAFLGELRQDLARRPRELFDQAARLLGGAAVHELDVVSEGPRFRVDGREPRRSFRGWSSTEATVALEIVDDDLDRFAGWYLGERPASDSPRFEVAAASALRLTARSRPAPDQRSRPTG